MLTLTYRTGIGISSDDLLMKKVILHVGQYKTGTTSIQKMMWASRCQLLESGVLYPRAFIRDGAHFLITDSLRKSFREPSLQVALDPLREEIESSRAGTAVISCETLSGATVRRFAPEMMLYMWQRLLELFDGCDVRVLFYVRRQDESIDSRIIQEIKGQSKKSFIDYEGFLYPTSSLNYRFFYEQLEQVFGKGMVDVRLYDRKYLIQSDVRYDFINYLGLPEECVSVPDYEDNVSPSSKLIALYRVINSMSLDDNAYSSICQGLWKEFGITGRGGKAVALCRHDRERIMAFYRDSNSRFVEDCVQEDARDSFAEVLFRSENSAVSNVWIDGVDAVKFLKSKGFGFVKTV